MALLKKREIINRLRSLWGLSDDGFAVSFLGSYPDFERVVLRAGGQTVELPLVVLTRPFPRDVRAAINREGAPLLLAAYYFSDGTRKLLKEEFNDVAYLDASGNAYVSLPGIYIDVNSNEKPRMVEQELKSLFSPKASRVCRALLVELNRRWKLVDLSEATGVSMGQASNVMRKLKESGYVSQKPSGYVLQQPDALLDEWSEAYVFARQNRIFPYYWTAPSVQRILDRLREQVPDDYALTSFAGASLLASYTRFQEVALYMPPGERERMASDLGMHAVDSGANLLLVEPYDEGVFYGRQRIDGLWVVSPVQLYLDLKGYQARGTEQAEFLREQLLARRVS